jgi:predicted membrane protein
MKKFYFLLLILAAIASPTNAQTPNCEQISSLNAASFLQRAACTGGVTSSNSNLGTEASVIELIGGAMTIVFSFLGILFTILLVYAGYLWLTARGNEEQVSRAQSILKNSIIGIIILFAAFVISREILQLLGKAINGTI